MKPDPSESSEENSLPPEHGAAKDPSTKATSETDLWDLDAPETETKPVEPEISPEPAVSVESLPEPVAAEPERVSTKRIYKKPEPIKKTRRRPAPAGSKKVSPRLDDTFDDLDDSDELLIDWEDDEISEPVRVEKETPAEKPVEVPVKETAPVVEPPSLRPRLNLTSLERIGVFAVLILLIAGGAFFFFQSINRLPSQTGVVEAEDFPIEGSRIIVEKSHNYWRAPITTGDDRDTFRRGTSLLPVLELEIESGAGAVRIFFRDELGEFVGDAISRTVNGATSLKIPATAGFDDIGMHAAYRTGQSKPWTVEVLEGPSVSAPSSEFKRLFQMPLSTDRR